MEPLFERFARKRAAKEGVSQKLDVGVERYNSSAEYLGGKEKLSFRHTFSTGETFAVVEDEDGIASIAIRKDGEDILSLGNFLPKGVKFVTPSYFKKFKTFVPDSLIGGWFFNPPLKVVSMWQINSPREILSLLHEIGHSYEGTEFCTSHIEERKKNTANADNYDEAYIYNQSLKERTAWSEGIKLARNIQKKYNVNLLEGFKDIEDVRRYIYGSLTRYRYGNEYEQSSFVGKVLGLLFGTEPKLRNDMLEGLFDKSKFKRKSA